jgi:DNA-binding CsgD family transcriptional regulator
MRTPRTIAQGVSEALRLLSLIVAAEPHGDPEVRRRAEHDMEIAAEALRRLALRVAGNIPAEMAGPRPRAVSLSPRERRVVDLLVANKTYKDIACEMGISVLSAQSRVKGVYMKLAVHSKSELRALVQENALAGAPVEHPALAEPVEPGENTLPFMDPHAQPSDSLLLETSKNQP